MKLSPKDLQRIVCNASFAYKRTSRIRRVVEQVLHDVTFEFDQQALKIKNLTAEVEACKREIELNKKTGCLILPW